MANSSRERRPSLSTSARVLWEEENKKRKEKEKEIIVEYLLSLSLSLSLYSPDLGKNSLFQA